MTLRRSVLCSIPLDCVPIEFDIAQDKTNDDGTSTAIQPPTTNAPPSLSRQMSQLTEQNVLLRHRLDTMEGAIQMLKKEMITVRTVLNPWVHTSTSGNAAGPSRIALAQNRLGGLGIDGMPPVVEEQAHVRRTSPGTTSRGSNGGVDAQSDDSLLEGADLASYFPAEDEVRVRRPPAQPQPPQSSQQSLPEYSHTQRQRPPGMGHMHHHSLSSLGGDPPLPFGALSMGYLGSPHAAASSLPFYGSSSVLSQPGPQYGQLATQPISVPIPDLDLSSPSLVTTLYGLHSSVASLASAIEDIHKKSDLALALMGGGAGAALPGGGVVGEVLRLGEEVMGVRATVQGLRMQMHGLMMGNVGMGIGMNMGLRPQGPLNPSGNGASANGEGGTADGPFGFPAQGGLQNQRMLYPGTVLGITKL